MEPDSSKSCTVKGNRHKPKHEEFWSDRVFHEDGPTLNGIRGAVGLPFLLIYLNLVLRNLLQIGPALSSRLD